MYVASILYLAVSSAKKSVYILLSAKLVRFMQNGRSQRGHDITKTDIPHLLKIHASKALFFVRVGCVIP